MWTWDYNIYLGDNSEDDHIGVATDLNLFIVAHGKEQDEQAFHEGLEMLKQHILTKSPQNLEDFTALMLEGISTLQGQLVSLAAVWTVEEVAYVLTRGEGEVYVARKGKAAKLIDGDTNSSGFIEKDDYFVLTNKTFSEAVTEEKLKKLLLKHVPQEVVETLAPELKVTNDVGMCALFMKAGKAIKAAAVDGILETVEVEDEEELEEEDKKETLPSSEGEEDPYYQDPNLVQSAVILPGNGDTQEERQPDTDTYQDRFVPQTQTAQQGFNVPRNSGILKGLIPAFFSRFNVGTSFGKRITLLFVVILVCVLGWSVFSGNARRERQKFIDKVQTQSQEVDKKLSEARDLAGLNTQRSLQLIDESHSIVADLQQEAKEKKLDDIQQLVDMQNSVTESENAIQKKEQGQSEEYYDLDLIKKGTNVDSLYTDGEILAMLDSSSKKVYILSLDEKSVDTLSSGKADKATRVVLHQKVPYIFGESIGVMRLTDDGKEEEVVPKDDEWGSIEDFWMYSGNMYLLDSAKNDVHKYVVAEEGYSDKRSYFGPGQTINLGEASAMAIDSSMYIAAGEKIMKYTSGARQTFTVAIPDEASITFDDIYSDADTDFVYLLDNESQRIFITTKEGEFKKQISASVIKKAKDFVVVKNLGILVLSDSKLYLIEGQVTF